MQFLAQTILFLTANPKGTPQLRLDQELREVAEGLKRSQHRDRFRLEQRWAVRPRDIQRAMLEIGPTMIHFSGHGDGEEGVVFEDESGRAKLVDGAALANLFALFADQVNCVVLNGCYSEVQAQAIAQHIPYVIGMTQAIGDRAAIEFSVGFYDALGAGRDVGFAFQSGCVAIQMEGIAEHLTPVLLNKPTSQSFRSQRPNKWAESPFIAGPPIIHPRHFFGRELILKRLFNLLKTHPLQNAAIFGPRRLGKTSLLHYLRTITTTPVDQLRPGQRFDWLPDPAIYRWIFVDFQDVRMASRAGLLSHLLKSMQLPIPDPCNLERFMDLVCGNIKVPTVILLDEIGVGLQRCPELDDSFWESIRSLAINQTDGNLAFVLSSPENPMELAHHTGHSSPFFNIFGYTTTLGPLTESEARELIARSPLPFSEDDKAWILSQSECFPLLIQILCRERLFSLEERNINGDWRIEGRQQIAQYQKSL